MKKILMLLILLTFVLASCNVQPKKDNSTNNNSSSSSNAAIGLSEGNMAPDFKLANIDGNEVKLSDYKDKIVVLNFFGVWCPWCVKEMPGFIKVLNGYKDKNVELLVVDVGDTKDVLKAYLQKNNFMINPVMDLDQKVSSSYKVSGFPTSYIIDKGIIKTIHIGYTDDTALEKDLSTTVR
jgi:peroxiredoxin